MDYRRPTIEPVEFRDRDGQVIDYGHRWQAGDAPEDRYSVVSHPERFAPLHTVATALIDHLTSRYAVEVEEGPKVVTGLAHPPLASEIVRALRLMPRSDDCAPLVITLTDFPAVRVDAGVLFNAMYPDCGCDACDETWDGAATELEWQLLAIAEGGLTETLGGERRRSITFSPRHGLEIGMGRTVSTHLRDADGGSEVGSESPAKDLPPAVLDAVSRNTRRLTASGAAGNWRPWPRKQEPGFSA